MNEKLKGTNISAPMVPFTEQDTFPTHMAKYGKGGYHCVQTIAERDNIPEERRENGMLVYVANDPTDYHFYQLQGNKWELFDRLLSEPITSLSQILD